MLGRLKHARHRTPPSANSIHAEADANPHFRNSAEYLSLVASRWTPRSRPLPRLPDKPRLLHLKPERHKRGLRPAGRSGLVADPRRHAPRRAHAGVRFRHRPATAGVVLPNCSRSTSAVARCLPTWRPGSSPTIPGIVANGSTRSPSPSGPHRPVSCPRSSDEPTARSCSGTPPTCSPCWARCCADSATTPERSPHFDPRSSPASADTAAPRSGRRRPELGRPQTRRSTPSSPTCWQQFLDHAGLLDENTATIAAGTRFTTINPDVVVHDPFSGAERPARVAAVTLTKHPRPGTDILPSPRRSTSSARHSPSSAGCDRERPRVHSASARPVMDLSHE